MSLTRITGNVVKDSTLEESKLVYPYVNVSGDTMTGPLNLPVNGLKVGTNQLVLSSGYVGIGNLSPAYPLDVTGSIRVSGQLITNSTINANSISLATDGSRGIPAINFANETNSGIYRSGSGSLSVSITGSIAATFRSSGILISGGTFSVGRTASLSSSDNVIEFNEGLDTTYIGRDASSINFRTDGVINRLVINRTGQVSVGTATTVSGIRMNVSGRVLATGGFSGILLSDLPTVHTNYGGTGLTSYTAGDLLYYSTGNTFSKLSAPASTSFLSMNDAATPSWIGSPIPVLYGGTGLSTPASNGQLLIGNGTSFTLNTIAAGTGISVTNGSGTIGIGVTNLPNSSLTNNSINVSIGSGLTGSTSVSLGGTLSISNTGVTGISTGSGISASTSTGNITLYNTGVTSAIAGAGISVTSATGNVTYSLDSSYAPTFSDINLISPLSVTNGGTGSSVIPLVNQVLYGNGNSSYTPLTLVGVGVTVTPDFNSNTLTLTADLTGASVSIISRGTSSVSIPQNNGYVAITTSGTEVIRVNTSQNVGIGTTNPQCKLDFGANTAANGRIIGLVTQPASNIFSGLGASPSGAGVRIAGTPTLISSTGEVANLGYYSTDGAYTFSSVLLVRNDGRVGINKTSPGYALDVLGDINTTGLYRMTDGAMGISSTTTSSTGQVTLDFIEANLCRTAKYIVQVTNTDNTFYQSSEVLVMHNGTTTYVTEYGIMTTNGSLGVIDATISGGNLNLVFTPTYPNNTIKIYRIVIGL